jgi:hypothetical protein
MTETRPSTDDKRRAFRQLHEAGCFVIPNSHDVLPRGLRRRSVDGSSRCQLQIDLRQLYA